MAASSDGPLLPVPFPLTGRLLGLDFGTKRLGLAVCNPEQTIASPAQNYNRVNLPHDAKFLRKVLSDYRIVGLIVGLPVHMSGDEGEKAREARAFGTWAAQEMQRPVRYFDERHTSLIARHRMTLAKLSPQKIKERLDMVAAQILLQNYLDSPSRLSPTELPPPPIL